MKKLLDLKKIMMEEDEMDENTTICYLDFVGLGYFEPEKFKNPMELHAKDYKDPDSCCEKLYNDLLEVYIGKFNDILGYKLLKEEGKCILYIEKDNSSYTMSSDFIGSSRASARDVGMTGPEVGKYLRKTRIIGGHMLWPVQYIENKTIILNGRDGTINTQRGGIKGFCDRIDCTLQDLKNFYDSLNDKEKNVEYKLKVFDKYKDWLKLFNNFESFIDFFFLNSFCDSDYRVFDLKSYNTKNKTYESFIDDGYKEISGFKISDKAEYESFISGNVAAICARQKQIMRSLRC